MENIRSLLPRHLGNFPGYKVTVLINRQDMPCLEVCTDVVAPLSLRTVSILMSINPGEL